MITDRQLLDAFVSPAMAHYFARKLAPLPQPEIDARVCELLKYLNLSAYSHGGIPFSPEIDDVWHLWILQTQEYRRLCQRLQGGRFVHHSSNEYEAYADPDVRTRPQDLQRGLALLRAYVLNYGPLRADRLVHWPLAERMVQQLKWSVEQLNAFLGMPLAA
jgi:hypothetical protein